MNFAQAKPVISPAEIERRMKHVATATADNGIAKIMESPPLCEIP
jgi:hypothetical protein